LYLQPNPKGRDGDMLGNLNGWHLVIILAIVLLLFGAPKLPGLARSIGQSARILRSEVKKPQDAAGTDAPGDEAGTASNTAASETTPSDASATPPTTPKS
jgi:sec-independent protein translocase protein TatA